MKLMQPFIEELPLGIYFDPHTRRKTVLFEKMTVCPSCRGMHSLRHDGRHIFCADCAWSTRIRPPVAA